MDETKPQRGCAYQGKQIMIPGIAKYFSARVPRYTSYPTAPHFSTDVDAKRYESWLSRLDPSSELSLYLHVPFCRQMCWYCGCNMRVIARYSPVTSYVDTLIREIELAARVMPRACPCGTSTGAAARRQRLRPRT